MLSTLLILFFTIFLGIIFFIKKCHGYWESRGLEYITPSIPFGNFLNYYKKQEGFGEAFAKFYGEFRRRGLRHGGVYLFWNPLFMPVDPAIFKDIFISSFDHFKNHGFYISKGDAMTNQLFNLEDEKWRNVRAKLTHAFTSGKMRQMFDVMVEHTKLLKQVLNEDLTVKSEVNVKKIMIRYTTDVVSQCLMGINTGTLKNPNTEIMKHGQNFFHKSWGYINNTIVLTVPRPILHFFNFKITPESTETFFKDLFTTIKNYRRENNEERGDFIDALIKLSDHDYTAKINDFNGKKGGMDPLSLDITSAQCYGFFMAGFETSSSTISYALYELARNEKCQDKLRENINNTIQKHNNNLTYNCIQDIEYLEMTLKETLRMYPAFPLLPRGCNKDYKVPGTDFTVKAGTGVILSNMGIQRDPEYWPNPLQFDPERFSIKNRDKIVPYTYFPFGEGPRLCIAHRFGQLQSKVGILTLIKNYRVTVQNKDMGPLKFASYSIPLMPKEDILLNFEPIC